MFGGEVNTEWDRLQLEIYRYVISPEEWIGRWLGQEDTETIARELVKESTEMGIEPFEFLKIVVDARELSYKKVLPMEDAIEILEEKKGFHEEERRQWMPNSKEEREFRRDIENTIRKMKETASQRKKE